MSPFSKHDIDHLSASSIALYRSAPALWVLRYLYRIQDGVGPSAWRGTAVEAGVDLLLYKNCTDDEAVAVAAQTFDANAQGDLDPKVIAEREAIPDYVRQAAKLLRGEGEPVARQFKVEHWIDGIDVPLIGYVDYLWPERLLDLKTTKRMPSEPRDDHAAQVVIYADATGREPGVAYVTRSKGAIYPSLTINHEAARRATLNGARAIRSMLAAIDSKEHAASLFAPNFDSFYWSETTIAAAMEIWR